MFSIHIVKSLPYHLQNNRQSWTSCQLAFQISLNTFDIPYLINDFNNYNGELSNKLDLEMLRYPFGGTRFL